MNLDAVAGVLETRLGPLIDSLGSAADVRAPAPWQCTGEALVWVSRPTKAAARVLQAQFPGNRPLIVVGGFIRYLETPVGPYDEVFAIAGSHSGSRPWGTVPFMAVDSSISLVNGRINWGLPKTLASFDSVDGPPLEWRAASVGDASWRVSASARPMRGISAPMSANAVCRQRTGSAVGSTTMCLRGRVRPAMVCTDVFSTGSLDEWLRPGRHLGAVVTDLSFSLGAPTLGAFEA